MFGAQDEARSDHRYGPGESFYKFIASLIDPDDVRFSEWFPDPETSGPEARNGRVFFVLPEHIVTITYKNILAGHRRGLPYGASPGAADVAWHPKGKPAVTWTIPDIESGLVDPKLGPITVASEDWSVDLPYSVLPYGTAPDYLARLLAALK